MHISRPTIGIVIPKDYFQRAPLRGNSGDYRSVLEITEAELNCCFQTAHKLRLTV